MFHTVYIKGNQMKLFQQKVYFIEAYLKKNNNSEC